MRYVATSAGVEENSEDEFLDVWLSETSDATGRSLSFQRRLGDQPDDDEADMGMDSYCVSTERGLTVYGPVREVRAEGGTIVFSFTPEDAQILRVDETVEVELGIDPELVPAVLSSLRDVLTWGREESVPVMSGL